MMKQFLIIFILFSFNSYSQIDYNKLIIGRNTGAKLLADGTTTRVFGFAETLSGAIDVPGPTIYMNEGDSVNIDFWNVSQGAPHTIHLHGLDVDQANDGVPHLSFDVEHMEHGNYRFKAPHAGTYIYHCHVVSPIHVQAGMYGVIIVRPPNGETNLTWQNGESFDREVLLTASEIDTLWHNPTVLEHDHDPLIPMFIPDSYNPQFFIVNGLSDSQLSDINNYPLVGLNETVLMRLVAIGNYGVRYIFPTEVNNRIIASDGRPLPLDEISDTVMVFPGERYESIIQIGTNPLYPVKAEFINLNTNIVESTQIVNLRTSAVGLSENDQIDFVLYPNPSIDGIFHSTKEFNSNYSIQDLTGKVIYKGSESTFDLSKFKKGIYLFKHEAKTKVISIL
jgi:hypothetical protein